MHTRNSSPDYGRRTAFYGPDLHSHFTSVRAVIANLESVDPDLTTIARRRYGCLSPWEADPAAYGRAVLRGIHHDSHIDNAPATALGRRSEHSIGRLCREHFGTARYAIGFGTHDGTVAAASGWGDPSHEPMQIMDV